MFEKTKNIYIFLLIVAILLIVYYPAINNNYVHHDDVLFWKKYFGLKNHALHNINISIGRFIGAHIQTWQGYLIHSIADLKIIRFLTILLFSISGFFLFILINNYFQNKLQSLLLSIIIFTLPPFQIFVCYSGIAYCAPAILLSLIAATLANLIPSNKSFFKKSIDKFAIISYILMLCSFSIYQPATMFYWAVATFLIYFNSAKTKEEKKQTTIKLFLVGITSTVLYALVLSLVKKYYINSTFGIYNPYITTTNYLSKLLWFIREPLVNSLNLWNIFPRKNIAYIVSSFIGISTLLFIYKNYSLIKHNKPKFCIGMGMSSYLSGRNSSNAKLAFHNIYRGKGLGNPAYHNFYCKMRDKKSFFFNLFFNFALYITLLLLSFSPNFLSSGNAAFYRCLSGLMSIIVFTLIWSIVQWQHIIPSSFSKHFMKILLLIIAFYGAYQANRNIVTNRIIPSKIEIQIIKNRILQKGLNNIKHIYIRQPTIEEKYRYDEFNTPTALYSQDIVSIIICVLSEIARTDMVILKNVSYHSKSGYYLFTFTDMLNENILFTYKTSLASGPDKIDTRLLDPSILVINLSDLNIND